MNKKTIKIIILAVSACFIVLLILAVRAYFLPKGILVDREEFPITGIDVSRHSGVIDWKKIKRQNINFVYIKATEGEDYLDPNYQTNVAAATHVKLNVGEYHFFRFNKPGKTQAANFLNHTKHIHGKLTPVVDVEEWGNMPIVKSDKEIRQEVAAFLREVKMENGIDMIIYTNINSYNRFIKGFFYDNPIWICSFNKDRIIPDDRNWLFWQHAHNGKLDGIKGLVDLNTFNGDAADWKMYLNSGTLP